MELESGKAQKITKKGIKVRHIGLTILTIILICFCFVFFGSLRSNWEIVVPSAVTILVFVLFIDILRLRVSGGVFGEIGFLYLFFAVVYTIAPAYGFLVLENLSSGSGFQNLALLLPNQSELGLHLWRHVVFIAAFSFGYLVFRSSIVPRMAHGDFEFDFIHRQTIIILFCLVFLSVFLMSFLSAPVKTYIDNYTRYDHLSWMARRIVTLCLVVKMGGSFVLLVLMFKDYRRYKIYIWCFILFISVYEIKNSFGSRIEAFFLLLAGLIFYHFCVKAMTLKKSIIVILVFGFVFSAVEVVRSADFDVVASKSSISAKQGMPAGELGAVYFTGFHLYSERGNGSLPKREFPMFFNDFISVLPFVDQTRWHPMFWYAKNYFPDSVVPPQTLSPIADSAIWGGEIDLILRSIINGLFFAWLANWFSNKCGDWRVFVIYVFCCATCIMCLKYSVFFHLAPVLKIIVPVILLVMVIVKILKNKNALDLIDVNMC